MVVSVIDHVIDNSLDDFRRVVSSAAQIEGEQGFRLECQEGNWGQELTLLDAEIFGLACTKVVHAMIQLYPVIDVHIIT
jgi:hypothetical protein